MSEKWAPSISRKKWLKLKAALTDTTGFDMESHDKIVAWFVTLIEEMESFNDEE